MLQMFSLQLLLLAALPGLLPAAFSSRSQRLQTNHEDDWNQDQADMEDLQLIYDLTRASRHADGLFTSGYSKLLGQLTAKDYLQSLIAKRINGDSVEVEIPVKRHSDAVFTDNYSRFRQQMLVKKYLDSVLTGKRSADEAPMTHMDQHAVDEAVRQLTLLDN